MKKLSSSAASVPEDFMIASPSNPRTASRPSPSTRGRRSNTSRYRPRERVPGTSTTRGGDAPRLDQTDTTGPEFPRQTGAENREDAVHGYPKDHAIQSAETRSRTCGGSRRRPTASRDQRRKR